MIISSNRKNLNQSENYRKFAHKLSWHACNWHGLGHQTFYGLSTNLQEQLQNGLRLATEDWQDWFRTFITQMTADNIVMWVTRLSIVDWVCFKTRTLLATLRTRSQPQVVSYVSSEAEHFCPHQLDVQETNVSIPQFCRVWNYFFGCWIAHGWTPCFRPLGHGNWSVTFDEQHCKKRYSSPRRFVRDRRPFHQQKQDQNTNWKEKATGWAIVKCGLRTHQHTFFSRKISVVHLWRQRSRDQDDYQRTKSNSETRVQAESTWNQRSKSNMLTPKTNLLTC